MLEDLRARFPSNPFVPPPSEVCFITHLPPELLSRIFEFGSSDDVDQEADEYWDDIRRQLNEKAVASDGDTGSESEDDGDDGDSNESRHFRPPRSPFPIIASHVCHHWRDVALSTPSLWANIVVTLDARPPYRSISKQLEWSKDFLVDILVNCEARECGSRVEEPSEEDLVFLFSMLTPHLNRWRSMKLHVSNYEHIRLFFSAISHPSLSSAPQFTTLELYYKNVFDDYTDLTMPKELTLFAASTPLLTKLVLWGVHVDWDQPWITSASNLVDLELCYHPEHIRPSWTQFSSILRSASALRKLTLRKSGPSREPEDWILEDTFGSQASASAPVPLLRTTDLVLTFHAQTRAIGLLRRLYLPALKSLLVHFDKGNYTNFVHELVGPSSSLYRARDLPHSLLSQLESLTIVSLPCRIECMKMLHHELQNLTTLHLSSWCLSSLFLDILRIPCGSTDSDDVPLPKLATLYVAGASESALRDVVQKRRDAGVPLRSLYVGHSCVLRDELVDWLTESVDKFRFFVTN